MIYMDYAAGAPLAPEVLEVMLPWLAGRTGNPSSIHAFGREARGAIDDARDVLAQLLQVDYAGITFCSGGTEADNLALYGVMHSTKKNKNHLIISAVEHHAVLRSAMHLKKEGFELTVLPVDSDGRVNPVTLEDALSERTALVSVMLANNEVGAIQDVARMVKIAHSHGALFHTDAVQSFGMLPLHLSGIGCDLASISSHKIYGPQGVGALYVRPGVNIAPLLHGGAQERQRRPGTENVAGIVGFARAAQLAESLREGEYARLTDLRDAFIRELEESIPGLRLNGPRRGRLPGNVNISIAGIEGQAALVCLDREGIASSSGSACSSGSLEPSHVLQALGLPPETASGGIRFSMGRSTTAGEVHEVVKTLASIVTRLSIR